jgi:hypothetical protein
LSSTEDPGSGIFNPKWIAHAQMVAIGARNCDDHFLISAFPFPLSASVFRFSFPFQLSDSSVSTRPVLAIPITI